MDNIEKPKTHEEANTTPNKNGIKKESTAQREALKEETRLTKEQKELLDTLKTAKNSEARVHIFGKFVDGYGLEAAISLIPELGDIGSSTISGLYLLYEAREAGLSKMSYLKIIGLQTADMFIGVIPVVGDAADFLFSATSWSEKYFKRNTDKLIKEAREKGIPEEEIEKITTAADKLPRLVDKVIKSPF